MQVKVRIKCNNAKCTDGIVYDSHCRACGQRIPSGHPWWSNCDNAMPCGHSARRYLVEEMECPVCLGCGWLERWMDIEEVEKAINDASKNVKLPA